MVSNIGNKRVNLKEELEQEAYRFDFDQAMHLLELISLSEYPQQDDFGISRHFDFEAVKIKGHISMAPQASPLWKCDISKDEKTLWINFLTLAGSNGPLPIPYTEILLDRLREKDHSFVDFLDIFQHRLARLWYHFQKTIQPSLIHKISSQNLFSDILTSMVGISSKVPIHLKSYVGFLQFFTQNEISIHQMERLLNYYFNLNIKIVSFIESFVQIPESDRTRIGVRDFAWNKLGEQTYLGHKMQDLCGHIMIKVSNLTYETYVSFCPNQTDEESHYQIFKTLCRSFFRFGRKVFLQLELKAQEVPYLILKRNPSYPLALGFNTWLKSKSSSAFNYKKMKIVG